MHVHDFLSKLLGEVVAERQDDLPCYECDEYGPILIVKFGDITRDMCRNCATKLGLTW